jgi:hypothetical protein
MKKRTVVTAKAAIGGPEFTYFGLERITDYFLPLL